MKNMINFVIYFILILLPTITKSSLCRQTEGKVIGYDKEQFILLDAKGKKNFVIRKDLNKNIDQLLKKSVGKFVSECVQSKNQIVLD